MDTQPASPSTRIALKGIDVTAFQHPLDRQATDQLKRIRGFDKAIAKFLDYGVERIEYVLNIASSIRVGPRQFPQLYAMLQECCTILDVPEPELYVAQGDVNAYTIGYTRPCIILLTGLIELMEPDEIMAVIAHELGHIKCGHVLYKTMARTIAPILEVAGDLTLGLGALVGIPIEAGLKMWDRRSELTGDRAALLVMQDAGPCVNMFMKLAGGTNRMAAQLDPVVFLEQARAYGENMDDSTSSRFYRLLAAGFKGEHPFAIERAKMLNDWVDSREFEQILAGNYTRVSTPILDGKCTNCGWMVQPGFKFCANCGKPLASI